MSKFKGKKVVNNQWTKNHAFFSKMLARMVTVSAGKANNGGRRTSALF
jgi:hypothetical protein